MEYLIDYFKEQSIKISFVKLFYVIVQKITKIQNMEKAKCIIVYIIY